MIKQNQKIMTAIHMVIDGIFSIAAISLAYAVRFANYTGPHFGLDYYLRLFILMAPIYVLIYSYFELYGSFRHKTIMLESSKVIKANIVGAIFIFIVMFMIKEVNISRMVLAIFLVLNTSISILTRIALRKMLRLIRKNGYNQKHILLIGGNQNAQKLCEKISANKHLGYDICLKLKAGEIYRLKICLEKGNIDEVIISIDYDEYTYMQEIISTCEKSGVKISIIPFYTKYLPARPFVDEIEGITLINLRRIPLDNMLSSFVKRAFDIVASLFLLIITSPIMLITSIIIKATSKGHIIFKQERIGLNKRNFTMYKFRSMNSSSTENTAWSSKSDPRRTKFGAFIRKYSIDELPQFINVLKGDMSLVGPRPEIPFYVEKFKEEIPLYMIKHQVRPGITGLAQVSGWRGDTSIEERIKCDIYYIENWTLLLDIKILIQTVIGGFASHAE